MSLPAHHGWYQHLLLEDKFMLKEKKKQSNWIVIKSPQAYDNVPALWAIFGENNYNLNFDLWVQVLEQLYLSKANSNVTQFNGQ